jgi:flagellin-like hook-associated protein FlgL
MEVLHLTAGMRSTLYSLHKTASLINTTQLRLSTGRRVNSALDDPINYFTAMDHRHRAYDLMAVKDGMSEAIQTIKAANNGIETTLSLIESAEAIANSALLAENNDQKADLANQYDEILSQINQVVDDSNYKGINLIKSDSETLEVTFDKTNNSKLTVVGQSLNTSDLGINSVSNSSESTGVIVDQGSINFSGYRTNGSVDDVTVTVNNPDALDTAVSGFQAAYHASLPEFGGDAINHPFQINVERPGAINTDYEGFSIHWDNASGTWSITDSGPWSNATISGNSDSFAIRLDPPPPDDDITGEALNGSLSSDINPAIKFISYAA